MVPVVLILVAVDNGLVLAAYATGKARRAVLILVVVDNGLVRVSTITVDIETLVLILVVVDYGLVLLLVSNMKLMVSKCLNPCCSGLWSRT